MPQSTISNFPPPSPWKSMDYTQAMQTAAGVGEKPDFCCVDGYDDELCGPLVTLHALASQSREDFCNFTNHAYRDPNKVLPGAVKEAALLPNHEASLMLMLSSFLVNQGNSFLSYYATHSSHDSWAASTSPSNVAFWLRELFPTRHVSFYTNMQKVNKLWEGNKPAVIAYVNNPHKHYMHILSPFTQSSDGKIEFQAFSLGKTQSFSLSKNDFDNMMREMIVAH